MLFLGCVTFPRSWEMTMAKKLAVGWIFLGALAAALCLLGPNLNVWPRPWWVWWEAASVFVTAVFSLAYYFDVFITLRSDPNFSSSGWAMLTCTTLAISSVAVLVVVWIAVVWNVNWCGYRGRAWMVFSVGTLFLIYDWIVARKAGGVELGRRFRASTLYLEVPLWFALLATAIAVSRHGPGFPHQECESVYEAFLAGAVGFQLLVGTTTFALIHGSE